jgi:hypothetical protein
MPRLSFRTRGNERYEAFENLTPEIVAIELWRRPHTKAVFSELIKSSSSPISCTALQKGPKFQGLFYGMRKGQDPGGAGVVSTDDLQRLNW